ncbi:MAG TPA: carbonic anhydrase family protein [Longimicrobiaceae bacterium]|nr:carbonic anhydrase family protein [Longimicrobiaceae bacterium]
MHRISSGLAALLLAAASTAAHAQSTTAPPAAPASAAWSYHGATGPAHWGRLSPAYLACDTGTRQSPIAIPAPGGTAAHALSVGYEPVGGPLFNNGHTVQMDVGPGGALTLDGRRYDLVQFHFHRPAEHLLTGTRYAAEVHMVHRDATGALAVLGTFITTGTRDTAWSALLAALPRQRGDTATFAGPVDLARLMHIRNIAGERVRTYAGSLTTPACAQGVTWLVRERPITLSAAQIARLYAAVQYSARPVQARHGRPIPRVVPPST